MIVPDAVRKCVAFLGFQRYNDGKFQMLGTAFFLGRVNEAENLKAVYAVTAKHVIENFKCKSELPIWFRINTKSNQATWFEFPIENWFFHPTDSSIDVAICQVSIPEDLDCMIVPYWLCITDKIMQENEVGLGDEVFITGLFCHHYGSSRNIPIVRVGNIACLTEEKIYTKAYGEMDAYLIESRSIGGLSGSPVFLNLGTIRMIQGKILQSAQSQPIFYLFGLIHGHYDVSADSIDESEPDEADNLTPKQVNTGMAIVVPFHKIDEVIIAYENSKIIS